LGPILSLAERDRIGLAELAGYGDLCVCSAAEGEDGELLREVIGRRIRSDRDGKSDQARIATVALLTTLVGEQPEGSLEDAFRRRYAQGEPNGEGINKAAWQGTILRSYSVAAWRRLWSWIVDCLSERRSLAEIGQMLADELEIATVGELFDGLPDAE